MLHVDREYTRYQGGVMRTETMAEEWTRVEESMPEVGSREKPNV
jgi:hypothetical protein